MRNERTHVMEYVSSETAINGSPKAKISALVNRMDCVVAAGLARTCVCLAWFVQSAQHRDRSRQRGAKRKKSQHIHQAKRQGGNELGIDQPPTVFNQPVISQRDRDTLKLWSFAPAVIRNLFL
ncbi:hypothetical protein G7K_5843-t1 [Saitoella complicata NRRL Y-17804]|uniref:Uncharacterized protein n=1 Tax=Saitoella complicata (strain BCRC 22490 / CBS 7301 / JCM 7358 / NBRC 10748 / NRRL Y-17804) TaxID=698492 RepID=A0A0E9NQQ0_SAICN|nr:hypothetical protein G7K_5843-t1 [Saitoella complicata NRRL Y-17804]